LINNAGFGSWGYADQIAEDRDLLMFRVNMITPYLLTRRYLPAMRARNAGTIVNMSSIAGIWNLPGFVSYGATKAFIRFFSLSLGMELRLEGSAVRVLVVCPSAVKNTKFQAKAGMNQTDMFDNVFTTTPEEVARDTLHAIDRGLPMVVSGRMMRSAAPLLSSMPRRLFSLVAKPNLSRTP
jgi:short-subunit dehydrogenase